MMRGPGTHRKPGQLGQQNRLRETLHDVGSNEQTRRRRAQSVWSILIIAIDVAALYALCVYDSRENLGTRRAA